MGVCSFLSMTRCTRPAAFRRWVENPDGGYIARGQASSGNQDAAGGHNADPERQHVTWLRNVANAGCNVDGKADTEHACCCDNQLRGQFLPDRPPTSDCGS